MKRITIESDDVSIRFTKRETDPKYGWDFETKVRLSSGEEDWQTIPDITMSAGDILTSVAIEAIPPRPAEEEA